MTQRSIMVVDTNVWLDYLLGRRANHESAQNFIMEACRRDLPLVIPSNSLKDVFFLFQQQLKAANRADGRQTPEAAAVAARRAAWAAVDFIMEMATIGPSDQSDAWVASKYRDVHGDYEDNLVVACAMRLDARLLVTNDAELARRAPVAAMNTADALALILAD
ncbi:MAG: type II toxin-antitoxin system VapC family toxin [Eggerthellaceae bacterium]|nr:type II toxin-antitoxin system VapC family toxin [Eggerthellaceae bacterium]